MKIISVRFVFILCLVGAIGPLYTLSAQTWFTFEKYGTCESCQDYMMEVSKSGGVKIMITRGQARGQYMTYHLSKPIVSRLQKELRKARFPDLRTFYGGRGTCLAGGDDDPTFRISVKAREGTKTVRHDTGCSYWRPTHLAAANRLKRFEGVVISILEPELHMASIVKNRPN